MIKGMLKNWVVLLFILASPCAYATPAIELVDDLSRIELDAGESKQLLILLVSQPDCSFCEYVKSYHLEPMLRNGTLDNVAIVQELDLAGISFTDFTGDSISPGKFARRYDAEFSPTLLFFSANGDQLHEAIIGVGSRDYYGFYLEKAIKISAKLLND